MTQDEGFVELEAVGGTSLSDRQAALFAAVNLVNGMTIGRFPGFPDKELLVVDIDGITRGVADRFYEWLTHSDG